MISPKTDIISHSVEETLIWAKQFAVEHLVPGSVVTLTGNLGAGKTHVVKGIAQAFGINPDSVNSPTFTLIHEYTGGSIPVYHFDLYRMKSAFEAVEIGAEDYFYSDGICCIEWSERAEELLPEHRFEIHIQHQPNGSRSISWNELGL